MTHKKYWILPAILLLVLLAGCPKDVGGDLPPSSEGTASVPAETSESAQAPTEASAHSLDITWATAFRDKSLPQGYVTPDMIAFYEPHEGGEPTIVNVPIDEVLSYVEAMEHFPRTHYYEQFMEENLQFVLQIIDYAMAKGYSRFSMPSTEIADHNIFQASDYINASFRMNNRPISSRTVKTFSLEDGKTLNYTLVVLPGMEMFEIDKYMVAMDIARSVVATVPRDYTEEQTALYLYHYLTENVRYDYFDYYGRDGGDYDWNLAYDALVKHRTVCAGYTEALYYLYNLAGIDCITVSGYIPASPGRTNGGNHIWNIAKVNGEYYYFDATWDEGYDIEDYQFYGISEEQLQAYYPREIATFDAEHAPTCDKTLPISKR